MALRREGRHVTNSADIVQLVRDADPVANTLVRAAGRHLGEVLAVVVNFFTPRCSSSAVLSPMPSPSSRLSAVRSTSAVAARERVHRDLHLYRRS